MVPQEIVGRAWRQPALSASSASSCRSFYASSRVRTIICYCHHARFLAASFFLRPTYAHVISSRPPNCRSASSPRRSARRFSFGCCCEEDRVGTLEQSGGEHDRRGSRRVLCGSGGFASCADFAWPQGRPVDRRHRSKRRRQIDAAQAGGRRIAMQQRICSLRRYRCRSAAAMAPGRATCRDGAGDAARLFLFGL
jgi:hypothetical protein